MLSGAAGTFDIRAQHHPLRAGGFLAGRAEIKAGRAEIKAGRAEIKPEMAGQKRDLLQWQVLPPIGQAALIAALGKLLWRHAIDPLASPVEAAILPRLSDGRVVEW